MSLATTNRQWVQLHLSDPHVAGVTVTPPEGDDLFSLSREMVMRAGRLAAHLDEIDAQLAAVQEVVQSWCRSQVDRISNAYVVLKGDGFLFLVVQKSKEYDRTLEDSLTDLDIEIAQNPEFNHIHLSVLAIPAFSEEAIESFLPNRKSVKSQNAQRTESPGACES